MRVYKPASECVLRMIIILSLSLRARDVKSQQQLKENWDIFGWDYCECCECVVGEARKIVKGHARSHHWIYTYDIECGLFFFFILSAKDKRENVRPIWNNNLPRLRFLSLLRFLGCTSPDMLADAFTVLEVILKPCDAPVALITIVHRVGGREGGYNFGYHKYVTAI